MVTDLIAPRHPARRTLIQGLATLAAVPSLLRGVIPAAIAQAKGNTGVDLKAVVTDKASGKSYLYDAANGEDLGDFAGRHFTQRCIRVGHPEYPLVLHFRPDRTGNRQEVVFELGRCWNNPPIVDLGPYAVQITQGDKKLYATMLTKHFWFTRWRWQSAPRSAVRTPADIFTAKLFPPMSVAAARGATPPNPVTYAGPMDNAGIYKEMGTTGERADIGLLTEWQAEYMVTEKSSALTSILAQAEASGSVQWHWRDEDTNAPINFYNRPNANGYDVTDRFGFPKEHINYNRANGFQPDDSHMPALWYIPYLITEDPYFLEEGQAAFTYAVGWELYHRHAQHNPAQINFSQVRAFAWGLRTCAELAKVTPEQTPKWMLPQSYYRKVLADSLVVYKRLNLASPDPAQRLFHAAFVKDEVGSFMQMYLDCAMALTVFLGFTDWSEAATWTRQFSIALNNGRSGWPRQFDMPYYLRSVPTATSWEDLWEKYAAVPANKVTQPFPPEPAYAEGGSAGYVTIAHGALTLGALVGDKDAAACAAWTQRMMDYGPNHIPRFYRYAFAGSA